MSNLKIGQKVFLVHKKSIGGVEGGRVILGKVTTFEYRKKKIRPVIRNMYGGSKQLDVIPENYHIFDNQEEAIEKLLPSK